MGRAGWVITGWPKILEGQAKKMKAQIEFGMFDPIQIGTRANWVRAW